MNDDESGMGSPQEKINFSLLDNIQTGSGAHPASYLISSKFKY
jgi:hypothetical protein